MNQLEQVLRFQIDELKAKIIVQRLNYQEEINRLKVERDQAISRAEEAEQKVKVFGEQKNSVKRERSSYKTLSELTDKQYLNARTNDIQKQLGPAYKIAKIDDSPDFSKNLSAVETYC